MLFGVFCVNNKATGQRTHVMLANDMQLEKQGQHQINKVFEHVTTNIHVVVGCFTEKRPQSHHRESSLFFNDINSLYRLAGKL